MRWRNFTRAKARILLGRRERHEFSGSQTAEIAAHEWDSKFGAGDASFDGGTGVSDVRDAGRRFQERNFVDAGDLAAIGGADCGGVPGARGLGNSGGDFVWAAGEEG